MFKDEYNKSINDIKPDGFIKEKILLNIENNNSNQGFFSRRYVKVSFAVALSLVIVFSSFGIWKIINNPFHKPFSSSTVTESTETSNNVISGNVSSNENNNSSGNSSNSSQTDNDDSFSDDNDFYIPSNKNYIYEKNDYLKAPKEYQQLFKRISSKANSIYSNKFGAYDGSADSDKTTSSPLASVESSNSSSNSSTSFSDTYIQVNGVNEADIVKTDGKYIYTVSNASGNCGIRNNYLKIFKAGEVPELQSEVYLSTEVKLARFEEMFLYNDRLVVVIKVHEEDYMPYSTSAIIYDISNPKKVNKIQTLKQNGSYVSSRMIDNNLYLITNATYNQITFYIPDVPESYVPCIVAKNHNGTVNPNNIFLNDDFSKVAYSVVGSYDVENGNMVDNRSVLGVAKSIYCSLNNIIIADSPIKNESSIKRFSINKGEIKFVAKGKIEGNIINQFAIDEYNGYFRFVTSSGSRKQDLFVLDKKLNIVGSIKNIAPGENLKSVYFMGDTAYFVTYRQVDPLFSVDLSDPTSPKIIGKLKIPGFSNYLFPYGEDKLLGVGPDDNGIKISMFDISDPSNVKETMRYVIDGYYAVAGFSHKAVFYDTKQNLIGVPVKNQYKDCTYFLFSFDGNQFTKEGTYKCDYYSARGFYIDKVFYITGDEFITTVDLNSFAQINRIDYK